MDKHIIVLNGKRYNAVTGELIGADNQHGHARAHHGPQKSKQSQHTHHDETHHKQHVEHQSQHQEHKPQHHQPEQHHEKRTHTREHHGTPRHAHAHKPQTAQTLMRRAVHKPNIQQPPTIKPRYPVATTESGVTVEAPKHSVHSVDDSRVQRSQKVHKSSHVGRFQATVLAPLRARVIPVSVSEPAAPAAPPQPEAPVPTPAVPPVVQPPAEPTPQPPVAPAPEPQPPVAPAPTPQPPSAPTPYTQPPVQQPYVAPQPQPKASIFERALQSAKSHEQPAHKARKRRVRSISAGIAAFVVLGGFVALLNQSTVSLQLASVRAGFQASAPSYTPNGFKQGGASVQGKSVSINYVSAEDGSATYTLTQESSNWDSQTLFDSIVTSPDVKYQLIQNNGRNIYVYGKSKAAWVDGGVLYRISGTAELDGNEIVSIASSL